MISLRRIREILDVRAMTFKDLPDEELEGSSLLKMCPFTYPNDDEPAKECDLDIVPGRWSVWLWATGAGSTLGSVNSH